MKCKATTARGDACGSYARADSEYCFTHDPARTAERNAARKKGGKNRAAAHSGPYSGPREIRSLADVLRVLDYALAETLLLANGIQRGRLLVAIAGEYTKALQVADLETRIIALEEAAKK
jgi:hypothetical protein